MTLPLEAFVAAGLGAQAGLGFLGNYMSGSSASLSDRHARQAYGHEVNTRRAELRAYLDPFIRDVFPSAYPSYDAGGPGIYNQLLSRIRQGPGEFTESPGYQFRLSQGVQALERGAVARGRQLSGAQGKALTRFGQDYASNEYDNFLRRYYARLQPYEGMVNRGMTAARQIASGPQTVQAPPQVQGTNALAALAGPVAQAGGSYANYLLLNELLKQRPTVPSAYTPYNIPSYPAF
jgi:hypothetical protein